MSAVSSKPQTAAPPLRRRRTKLTLEKKIADDEFMAAAIGDVEWLKQSLKDSGSEINFDKNGLTAIHLAAIHGRLECLKLCIEKFKVDINLPSSTGWRPIHLCISNQTGKRSMQCLVYLLENGADSSIANDDGITPVHQAASEGHVQCLKILIEVGAKIDCKDCRGNTPLDLAKLWGHRKCARILAAEKWHQDKAFVAKEMQQLKKVKMLQVLKELEEEEEIKAAQQFYGDEAFKQWMATKSETKTSPEKFVNAKGQDNRESIFRPNSISRKTIVENQQHTTKEKVIVDGMKITAENGSDFEINEDYEFMDDKQNEDNSKKNKLKKRRKTPNLLNLEDWNISTKATDNQYVPGLEDDYPRDEYTMMPKVKGAPKYFEGKFVAPLTSANIDEDIKRKGSGAQLRKPKLPAEIINQVLGKDSTVVDRGMIFKCKHIEDVHTKRKYDADKTGRSEAPLHLTNDVTSFLVQNSVRLHTSPKTSSSRSDSKSGVTNTEWRDKNFPLPLVMQTLKNMNQPRHFPNIKGNETLFMYGNVK
ncbi:unnamed protein product [Lymnaea stagnalis]|uniref:Ankyrin repeat domain-containing protein 53 n=1 Tax=Lymnaea stagnalis TaxID=6523 RepID=A0AAV2H7L9_LYMST